MLRFFCQSSISTAIRRQVKSSKSRYRASLQIPTDIRMHMYACIRIRIYKYLIVSGFAPRLLVACERERASWREDKRMKEREGGGGRRDDSSGAIYHASPKRVLKAMKLKAELLFLPLLSVAMRKSSCLPRAAPTPASPPPLPLPACCLCALPTPSNPRSCVARTGLDDLSAQMQWLAFMAASLPCPLLPSPSLSTPHRTLYSVLPMWVMVPSSVDVALGHGF